MDYQQVRAVFFTPPPAGVVEPDIVRQGGPARRLRDALEPIAMHAVWCARTNEQLASTYGLDFLGAYIWGRASALGEPAPEVVAATFAVFEPGMITTIYRDARAKVGWHDLVATRDEATTASLRDMLEQAGAAAAQVAAATAVLRRGIEAADPAGRPLFAGLTGRDWPTDPYGQLWRACDALREHRGDSHVAACVAAGLDSVEMNVLTELWLGMPPFTYSATRGWPADRLHAAADRLRGRGLLAGDRLTADGQRVRTAIEGDTDRAQRPVVDAIGADLAATTAQLAAWSAALVAAGAFPPDVHKRAAG
jgi:Helix-turn-helix family